MRSLGPVGVRQADSFHLMLVKQQQVASTCISILLSGMSNTRQ